MYDSLSKGDEYEELTKTVVILFINYDDNLIDSIPKLNTSWHIREDTYTEIILTDFFEFRIISLKKLEDFKAFDDNTKNSLISWLRFLKNPNKLGVTDMENEEIKKAKNEFEKVQMNDEERELARLREKYFYEMHDAEKTGVRKVAKKMKDSNEPIEKIIKFTGLTKQEIEKL